MSHIPQRQEKDCLNCGTIVQGRYCQNCGQENVIPHETFWHMVKHFLYDITHFDSKFFDSMKFLLLKPGFLPSEYIKGKRSSYLNPVKKYVFTSAIFFIIFWGILKIGKNINSNFSPDQPLTGAEKAVYIKRGEEEIKKNPKNEKWQVALQFLKDTNRIVTKADMIKYWDDIEFISFTDRKYSNRKEYDSVQNALSPGEKDSWIERLLQRKNLQLKEKYRNDPGTANEKMISTFLHKLPYMLFVSLPLFALILKLLYIRRKNFYYADHGIFSIYHYIFTFILLLFVFGFDKLSDITGFKWINFLGVILFLSGGLYLYLSMKKFYGQGHGKTIIKFLLLNITAFITMLFLFIIFLLLSLLEI